jgi:phosphatidate cytidylyltransferase
MLTKRIASAVVLIPLVGLFVYLGGWWLAAMLVVAGLLATVEYLQIAASLKLRPVWPLLLAFVPLAVLDAQLPAYGIIRWAVWVLMAVGLAVEVWHGNREGSLQSWAITVSGGYIALGVAHFASLRALPDGLWWVVLVLVGTWVSDTGAYLAGSRWGKRKLAPAISPGKTWAGLWGGLVSGVLTVWLIGRLGLGIAHWQAIVLGVVLVVAATVGDLAESVIKRQAGLKDSGALIPGHGGMFDRIDSLLFVAPTVYYGVVMLAISG